MWKTLSWCGRCCRDLILVSLMTFIWREWRKPRKYQSWQTTSVPKFEPETSRTHRHVSYPLHPLFHRPLGWFQCIWRHRVTNVERRDAFFTPDVSSHYSFVSRKRVSGNEEPCVLLTMTLRVSYNYAVLRHSNSVISNVTDAIMKTGTALNAEKYFSIIEWHKALAFRDLLMEYINQLAELKNAHFVGATTYYRKEANCRISEK